MSPESRSKRFRDILPQKTRRAIEDEQANTTLQAARRVFVGNNPDAPSIKSGRKVLEAVPETPESDNVRVVTVEELRAEARIALDEYYTTHLEADDRGRWKRRLPRIETGPDFYSAVGAAALVELDYDDQTFALPGDKLGIFQTANEATEKLMGSFFQGFMEESISLVRKIHDSIYKTPEFVSRASESRQGNLTRNEMITLRRALREARSPNSSTPTDEQVAKFLGYSDLVVQMLSILNLTKEGKNRYVKRDRKPYALTDATATVYDPGRAIENGFSYRAQSFRFIHPAFLHYEIQDAETNQALDITFFPLRYTKFEGRGVADLSGISIEMAGELMHERARDLRMAPEIDEILKKAQATAIEPFLEVSLSRLEDEAGEKRKIHVSTIHGALSETPKGERIESSLELRAEGFPGIPSAYTFDSRPKKMIVKNEDDAKLPLVKIAEGFARLSI